MDKEEKLFEAIENIRRDKHQPWRYVLFTFLNGIAQGLGFGLGMTLVFGLAIYFITMILAQLINFPVIGHYFGEIANLIDTYAKSGAKIR